ncbi:hypothetical protein EV121DRAFT_283520 [Schizophyllum commune]
MTRPSLPVRYANSKIQHLLNSGAPLPPVKYQVLTCQGTDIIVGRMKVETPTSAGHSFILRRFDSGAISLTTMYRAAFPDGPEDVEKSEYQWVKENNDLTGTNGSSRDTSIPRLAGTWVPPDVALKLAQDYAIAPLIQIMVDSKPDPDVHYRKSAKSAASSKASSVNPPPNPPTPAAAPLRFLNGAPASPAVASPPSKRRKESSPGPSPGPLPVVTPGKTAPRRSTRSRTSPSPAPTPTRLTRARTKSPPVTGAPPPTFGAAMSGIHASDAPSPAKPPSTRGRPLSKREAVVTIPSKSPVKPSSRKQNAVLVKKESRVSVAGSDETAVEDTPRASRSYEKVVTTYERVETDASDEAPHDEDEGHQVMSEAMEEMHRADVQEQKQMVSEIMAAGGRNMNVDDGSSSKRAREEDDDDLPKTFEPKEPETEMRLIKSNPRVGAVAPERKAAAWGTGLFVFGVGALTLLPNLASQWL